MTDTLGTKTAQPKKGRGGDTSAAARANGRKVGPRTKGESPYTEQILVRFGVGDVATLDAYAGMQGVTRQDIIREAVAAWCREKMVV